MAEKKQNTVDKFVELEQLVQRLKNNLVDFKRPLVIEFAGTPQAGKTTSVDALKKFFNRNGISVYVIPERASTCPIKDKHHMIFNIWTGCMGLIQLLSALERNVSVIILDRGLFDVLVWMDLHRTSTEKITDLELQSIENFYLIEKWLNKIDIVIVLLVTPKESLTREHKVQITEKEGSIMNLEMLNEYNESLGSCLEKYKNDFPIHYIETTDKELVEAMTDIASEVLDSADRLVDEEIAVLDRKYIFGDHA